MPLLPLWAFMACSSVNFTFTFTFTLPVCKVPVQTGPGAHPASCKMGTGSFPEVKCGRGVLLTTQTCNGNTLPFFSMYGTAVCYCAALPKQSVVMKVDSKLGCLIYILFLYWVLDIYKGSNNFPGETLVFCLYVYVWYDMLTAVGLTPGGSSTLQIYT